MYRFSIIIPVYNGEKYIITSINNILNQKFDNYELILINDGSTDSTSEKLSAFAENKRINIIDYKVNKGVSYARNIGIKNAKGEFLLFLDSDDFLAYNCLAELSDILSKKDHDIVSYGFIKTFNKKVLDYSNFRYNNTSFKNTDFLEKYFTRTIPQCMCSFVCKKEIIVNNNILFSENIYFAEDQEFQIKCMFYSKKIFYTSSQFFKYNLQDTSVMNSAFSVKRLTIIDAFMNVSELFKSDNRLKKLFINYFLYNYYGLKKLLLKSDNLFILKSDKNINYKMQALKPSFLFNKISISVNSLYLLEKFFPFFFTRILKKIS